MSAEMLATLVTRCKKNLRVSHSQLDSEIEMAIKTACQAMQRAGVSEAYIKDPDPVTQEAIIAYVMYRHADGDNDGYFASWQYQTDCIRRHREAGNAE
jgi:hypothetical protein